jgi:hypothetical protein
MISCSIDMDWYALSRHKNYAYAVLISFCLLYTKVRLIAELSIYILPVLYHECLLLMKLSQKWVYVVIQLKYVFLLVQVCLLLRRQDYFRSYPSKWTLLICY